MAGFRNRPVAMKLRARKRRNWQAAPHLNASSRAAPFLNVPTRNLSQVTRAQRTPTRSWTRFVLWAVIHENMAPPEPWLKDEGEPNDEDELGELIDEGEFKDDVMSGATS